MVQQRERRLLGEWMWEFHPDVRANYNYPLGAYAEPLGYRAYMSRAPRCDVLWIENGELTIVEAKLVDEFKGIAELMNYRRLVPKTTSLKEYWDMPINLILLRAREKEDVTDAAIESDIIPVLFRPQWAKDRLAELVANRRQR